MNFARLESFLLFASHTFLNLSTPLLRHLAFVVIPQLLVLGFSSLAATILWLPASLWLAEAVGDTLKSMALQLNVLSLTPIPVSGLSAAHTIYLAGGNVTVLDKQGEFRHRFLLIRSDTHKRVIARFFRRKLNKGHIRNQRRPFEDAGRPGHR